MHCKDFPHSKSELQVYFLNQLLKTEHSPENLKCRMFLVYFVYLFDCWLLNTCCIN